MDNQTEAVHLNDSIAKYSRQLQMLIQGLVASHNFANLDKDCLAANLEIARDLAMKIEETNKTLWN